MIIEDSEFIQKSLSIYLARMGYIIYEASKCQAWTNIIRENDIDLFLVDIDMPDKEIIV